MIDISKLFEVGRAQIQCLVTEHHKTPAEALETVMSRLIPDLLDLLIKDYFNEFKANIQLFVQYAETEYKDIENAHEIIHAISDPIVENDNVLKEGVSKIRFLQKDKNNLIEFTDLMKNDLAIDNIDQFIAFYSSKDTGDLKVCNKITDWITMMGYLEMFKLKLFAGYQ
jgi:hypothetical protein